MDGKISRHRSCRKAFKEVYRIVSVCVCPLFPAAYGCCFKNTEFFAIASFVGKDVVLAVMFVTFAPQGVTYSGKFK